MHEVVPRVHTLHRGGKRRRVEHVAGENLSALGDLAGQVLRAPRETPQVPIRLLEARQQQATDIPGGAGEKDRFAVNRHAVTHATTSGSRYAAPRQVGRRCELPAGRDRQVLSCARRWSDPTAVRQREQSDQRGYRGEDDDAGLARHEWERERGGAARELPDEHADRRQQRDHRNGDRTEKGWEAPAGWIPEQVVDTG